MSAEERDLSILRHIVDYCDQISMAVNHFGNDYTVFSGNQIYRNSVSLCILQIGELVGILSDKFKSEYSAMPWRQIKLMRNIVAHRYGMIDNEITWDVVQNDIPALKSYCESIIESK